jgi:hypothetical protein
MHISGGTAYKREVEQAFQKMELFFIFLLYSPLISTEPHFPFLFSFALPILYFQVNPTTC